MKSISTHILDVSRGRPAAGVHVKLDHLSQGDFKRAAVGVTDADGRIRDWQFTLVAGTWRIRFETAAYFENLKEPYFYPYVEIVFDVHDASQHYHVPLLLSAYGFSTYRGS
ncbi:hydroxyisourate hydrolase [Turneriella parva]|uniref:5-hydroxyisourate hydrolase n=1 Tax=Turneriella parva (strain ATCC BAA-1111 / DSM 21527 / NCTC 11395 / H) TaxID=869212 RepID=I4B3W9_TURPD|nr:hydroxyisourate hydrolase [Turneriella parva]AFM11976.1 hydroxyisourate hydrolase [Turneriella parva DSM 21527]